MSDTAHLAIDLPMRVVNLLLLMAEMSIPNKGFNDGVETVAWSSDGKRIASGSADTTVQA